MAEEYVLPLKVIEELKEELRILRTTGRNDMAEKIKEAKAIKAQQTHKQQSSREQER